MTPDQRRHKEYQEEYQEWRIAFNERKALFMAICELRGWKTPNNQEYFRMTHLLSKHYYVFRTKEKKIIIFDDPYIPSIALERQRILVARGWQLQHLPTRMSLRVAGKCQPSLLAAPNTQVDLKFIQTLLKTAGFTGNMVLRESFQAAGLLTPTEN